MVALTRPLLGSGIPSDLIAKRVLQLTSYLVTAVVDLQAWRLLQIHNVMVLVHYLPLFHISLCSIHY